MQGTDLLARTAELVAIPSVSHREQAICDHIESLLVPSPWLEVVRVGDNVVARTDLGRPHRLILAGHTDTVPASDSGEVRIEGERLYGLGSSDMKGGLAVMVELARSVDEPVVDVTYVFYAREEVALAHSGLRELAAERPDLLDGDAAVLGEPTLGALEAGCQGTMRLRIELRGSRAHTARPWQGRNAAHRLGPLLCEIDSYQARRPVLEGCEYREALQVVGLSSGVSGNVVPDVAEVLVNHRFAPDRSPEQAEQHLRAVVAPHLEDGDLAEVVDVAAGAAPGLDHPLLAALVERNALQVQAKLGWTDVAFFAERGVPAVNFGPGNPTLAHTAGEYVERGDLQRVHDALRDLLTRS